MCRSENICVHIVTTLASIKLRSAAMPSQPCRTPCQHAECQSVVRWWLTCGHLTSSALLVEPAVPVKIVLVEGLLRRAAADDLVAVALGPQVGIHPKFAQVRQVRQVEHPGVPHSFELTSLRAGGPPAGGGVNVCCSCLQPGGRARAPHLDHAVVVRIHLLEGLCSSEPCRPKPETQRTQRPATPPRAKGMGGSSYRP